MSFPFDDAYITFRYAQNFANGNGIVWNIGGPPTEGYTNFLLVLILSPFAFFHADLMMVSQAIGIVSTILTGIFIYKFIRQISESDLQPIVTSIIYLLLPFTWANAFNGLETSLFISLVLASFYFAIKKKWDVAFILVSFLCLTRPEGALAGIILAVASIYRIDRPQRSQAIRAIITYFIVPMTVYAAFKLFYFGNLLPNSFYIKTGDGGFHGVQSFREFVVSNAVLLGISLYALWRHPNERKMLLPILIWSSALILFYLWPEPLQGFYFRFEWPSIPALVTATAFVISIDKIRWRSMFLFILVIVLQGALSISLLRRDMQLATIERGRQIYHELGLALHSIPNHEHISFAFQDVGAIPYYSEMQNIDLVGLNTTAIARSKTPFEACSILDSMKPDIILIPAFHETRVCWNVFHAGHGKAGALTPVLIHQPMMDRYSCVGRITYLGYDILCYTIPAETESIHATLSKYGWFIPGPVPCLE